MKIALCSSDVPFIQGGARNIVEWLHSVLEERGLQVERIYLPELDVPDLLFQQMGAFRWVDLTAADRIICFRPQSHLIPHPHKILWFIHHIRIFYDLWDTPYRNCPDDLKHRGIREALHEVDTAAMNEAKRIFTNSKVVSCRLKRFNGVESEVLYPPVFKPERFFCRGYNDEIVCVGRLEHHKRQHLLIEAMQFTRSPVRLRLCGVSSGPTYLQQLRRRISELKLQKRVSLENRWISEDEKVETMANCLAVAYVPVDEDSYGYACLEGSHSSKGIITTTDAGGVLELVRSGFNGLSVEPDPRALADAMDRLYWDRTLAANLGHNAQARLSELNVSWPHVLESLLG